MAAAIQLQRQGVGFFVFEQAEPGGLLWNANLVENYPGFPDGISGPGLVDRFTRQFAESGGAVENERVELLDRDGDAFIVSTARRQLTVRFAVVASGTCPLRPDRPAIPEDNNGRVLFEVKAIRQVSGKRVVIVGAGDAAFDYALGLAGGNEVLLLNRGDATRCLSLLERRATERSNLEYRTDTTVDEIVCRSTGLRLKVSNSTGTEAIDADYLLFATGRKPELSFLAPRVRNQLPRLKADGLLHLVGDVGRGRNRQTAIAVGDGVAAAMDIGHRLGDRTACG